MNKISSKLLAGVQTEVDASFLYGVVSKSEKDSAVAKVFAEMADIEKGHARAFLLRNGRSEEEIPGPSFRARTLHKLSKLFGTDIILGVLLSTEKSLSNSVLRTRKKVNAPASISDTAHVTILKNILANNKDVAGSSLARFEKRHRSVGGNALRAAVLGGNDGLVSNFSLVMGVAGATSGRTEILLAGFAGMFAGALSMALGEWISVKSSQELYENQMELEMDELEINPEGEEREIALIYRAKGIPEAQAFQMANDMMKDKTKAHELLVREELGINPEELQGSAMEAAVTSFFLFCIGAIIPLISFLIFEGNIAILLSAIFSAVGLFIIGSAITLFTGKNMLYSGMRQVLFGLCAAAITFGIGKLVGASI